MTNIQLKYIQIWTFNIICFLIKTQLKQSNLLIMIKKLKNYSLAKIDFSSSNHLLTPQP